MRYSFSGVSTDNDTEKFLDHFEETCEDFFQSKKVFHHEEDDYSFDYRYCVAITDMREIEADDNRFAVELYLVPEFESLCDKCKDDVRKSCCYSDDDQPTVYDVYGYGISVQFGYEMADNPDDKPYDENAEVLDALTAIANTYEATDRLRGFYLDKFVNRIGTTGWDLLDDFINGVDYLQTTLNRYKTDTDDDE